jgi:omega-6 fatty acid desaturase (delta-12 desaturase)
MVVRLFMLQHDCGHGAFFKSQKLNNLVGTMLGVFTLVPYDYWRKTHAIHHATSGNLDLPSLGDIDTLTVKEYLSRSKLKRILYRLYRHPAVMLLIGPDRGSSSSSTGFRSTFRATGSARPSASRSPT